MPLTIREALRTAAEKLTTAGVDAPQWDATLLLAHALGRDRTYLYAHLPDPLPAETQLAFETLLERRAAREPLPYLLGAWEFLGMRFEVGPGVLIPRPETEVLVETVAAQLGPGARILDVGAGSGCISAGLAKLLPDAWVIALEPSPEAAAIAERNAAALGVADRVRIRRGRFPEDVGGLERLDAVVSNPPYIPSAEVEGLAPELRLHEPRLALDGGADGLDVLGPLARVSPTLLKEGGLLAVEVARGQAERVAGLLRAEGSWSEPEIIPDLAGIPRVVLAQVVSRGRGN